MQVSIWKKWLSYLFEVHIESTSSEISGELYVVMRRGRFQLCTANAVYSFEDLYVNFSRAFDKVKLDRTAPMNVLVLGIGMGSIPIVMESMDFEDCYFTAIEIDPVIIALLNEYGLPKIDSPIEVYETDAVTYAAVSREKFDLITIDLFINDIIPEAARSSDFLTHIKNRLAPEGLVMMNHLALTQEDQEKGRAFFKDIFKSVYPQSDYIDVDGNYMFISDASQIKR